MIYPLFPYRPSMPIEEVYEWKTDILEAHLGNEQRLKIRKFPRQNIEYTVMTNNNALFAKLKSLIYGNFENRFVVPIWPEAQRLAFDLSFGNSFVSLNTEHHDFQDDGYVFLWEDEDFNEIVQIDSIGGGVISLKEPTNFSYSELAFIMPAKRAYLEQKNVFSVYSDNIKEIVLSWEVEFNRGISKLFQEIQYKDHDVLVEPFDVDGNSITKEINKSLNKIDYQTGAIEVFSRMDWHRQSFQNVHFYLVGRERIWNFKRWLHNLCGRLNSFWLPNFEHDIQVTNYGTTLTIQNIHYYRYLQDNPLFQHVICHKYDGSVEIREITGCAEVDYYYETITLSGGLGSASDIKAIYFLGLYRLDTDRVELSYEDTNEMSVSFPVIGVEE